jgi:ATP adenylyltransferase
VAERPLWAPWRIEYITAPKEGVCIFCAAAAAATANGGAAQQPLERGERCFTLLNAFPYGPGHLMVAPLRHVGELEELSDDELLETTQMARRAVRALRDVMTPDGFNLGLNLGKVAGAGIADHLHLHVVPRWDGDNNFMPVLADTHVISQALEDTRAALIEALERVA